MFQKLGIAISGISLSCTTVTLYCNPTAPISLGWLQSVLKKIMYVLINKGKQTNNGKTFIF